jgi:hypothetical protein
MPAPAEPMLRKRWEEPRIVLERSLEVTAQAGWPYAPPQADNQTSQGPMGAPMGFLGPLNTSGGTGRC